MKDVSRREFLKYGLGGMTAVVVGSGMPWFVEKANAAARVTTLNFHITDALKDMATHNSVNSAQCYFWVYKEDRLPAESPGPSIFVTEGDTVRINITNDLDEPHAFYIPGMFNSGPIAPGQTVRKLFIAKNPATHLYYDNLNTPVNRVMGLHGAIIVMPKAAPPGHRFTPYGSRASASVQELFDHFGTLGRAPLPALGSKHFPGLSWEEGDPATNTPPFRTVIWLFHQASPTLFAAVGDFTPGLDFPADHFVNQYLHDEFSFNSNENLPGGAPLNDIPKYFTISGQSGHFSHNNPYITPNQRVGEPTVIRILNAGLWTISMHLHCNHFYITYVNGVVQSNPIWVDLFNVHPMTIVDYTFPFIRPPDIPNVRGIGRADAGIPAGISGGTTWPPDEELHSFIPGPAHGPEPAFQAVGTAGAGGLLGVQLSPLCYPAHDHSEPSQTAQGGNYNMGLIAGLGVIGDRNTPGAMNFPNQPLFHGPGPGSPHGIDGVLFPTAVQPPYFIEE